MSRENQCASKLNHSEKVGGVTFPTAADKAVETKMKTRILEKMGQLSRRLASSG
jgi:hypothetical protein